MIHNVPMLFGLLLLLVVPVTSTAFAQSASDAGEFGQTLVGAELLRNFQINNILLYIPIILLTSLTVIIVGVIVVVFAGRMMHASSVTSALGLDKLSRFREEKPNANDK